MSDLVEVHFVPDERTCWVTAGTTLVAAGGAAGVEIVTGCTEGMCGTDAVLVRSGADGLSESAEPERGTLERMGLPVEYRLACSARVVAGRVVVETGTF